MKQELIRSIVAVGNSAGVILPREWLNGKARINLVEEPLNIKKEILEILGEYLDRILGVYIVGSYARNEETDSSDIDILVISDSLNKRIEKGKYQITMTSLEELDRQIKSNALPLIPMIREAKPIINASLLREYKSEGLNKENLRFHIETTKSALDFVKSYIKVISIKEKCIPDDIMYSIILRTREVYIVDCIIKNKIASTKELISLIKRLTGDSDAYYAYKRSKENSSKLKIIEIEKAYKLIDYINKRIKEQEIWVAKRGKENKKKK